MQSMVQQKMVSSALQVLTSLFAYMQTLPDYPEVAPIQQQYGPAEGWGGGGIGCSCEFLPDQNYKIHTRFETLPLGRNYVIIT